MLNRFKSAIYNVVGTVEALQSSEGGTSDSRLPPKFPYRRPEFLQLSTEDEVLVSGDHSIRPIIVPRDINRLPWKSGYAEAVNAGKSVRNEDQATVHVGILQRGVQSPKGTTQTTDELGAHLLSGPEHSLPYVYFGMFDGHAGAGAAIAASHMLHGIIRDKLSNVLDLLLPLTLLDTTMKSNSFPPEKEISPDLLVIGALESAFWDMDQLIAQEKTKFLVSGGCTALAALFILGKVYVANAGDSRSIICRDGKVIPMSQDFTPESERHRIRNLALVKPELLGNEFTVVEFSRRPIRKDLGKQLLYREAYMTGWIYKTVTQEDLKFPLVYGEGKRSRVLATIGVTRGFGDHDLKALNSNTFIKPFLTPQPEVIIFDVMNEDLTPNDVLVMGTDGLWDITSNETAAELLKSSLAQFPMNDEKRYRYRYTSAAQDLVMHSRGKLKDRGWRTTNEDAATIDDISVFVIPLLPYKWEFSEWQEARRSVLQQALHDLVTVRNSDVPLVETRGLLPDAVNSPSPVINDQIGEIPVQDIEASPDVVKSGQEQAVDLLADAGSSALNVNGFS